jgi:peptidyl-prolyl cis-trans isomerase B (cyclophilin B)
MRVFGVFLTVTALFAAVPLTAQTVGTPHVLIQTSMGDITLALDADRAPGTVENFLRYVNEGHYDNTLIYRVVPGFVIQMGSYDADGTMRPVHDPIRLEAGQKNVRGAVAMARWAPNSATAEFFIDLADLPQLDPQPGDMDHAGYAVFGHVVSGMDVVDKIAAVPRGGSGPMPGAAPLTPIVIEKMKVVP